MCRSAPTYQTVPEPDAHSDDEARFPSNRPLISPPPSLPPRPTPVATPPARRRVTFHLTFCQTALPEPQLNNPLMQDINIVGEAFTLHSYVPPRPPSSFPEHPLSSFGRAASLAYSFLSIGFLPSQVVPRLFVCSPCMREFTLPQSSLGVVSFERAGSTAPPASDGYGYQASTPKSGRPLLRNGRTNV
ncbi:hypothetical protein V8E53_014513 [Lactarius tabidus]